MGSEKRAMITGVTGQDGSYLAELAPGEGLRGARDQATRGLLAQHEPGRPHLREPAGLQGARFRISTTASLSDSFPNLYPPRSPRSSRTETLSTSRAQSFRRRKRSRTPSRRTPPNVDGLGALRLLEAIRFARHGEPELPLLLQASTSSELYGLGPGDAPDRDDALPPALALRRFAKLYAYWTSHVNYRESYGTSTPATGILFNHESPRRGFETFVTRKITSYGLARVKPKAGGARCSTSATSTRSARLGTSPGTTCACEWT